MDKESNLRCSASKLTHFSPTSGDVTTLRWGGVKGYMLGNANVATTIVGTQMLKQGGRALRRSIDTMSLN